MSRYFRPADQAEVTIEANPEDVSEQNAERWKAAGVNRLSLGAQTFNDSALKWMHRTHDAAMTEAAVRAARLAGITNLSLDLIFALPAELRRNFTDDVERLLALDPDHVSLYGLTVESNTALGKWVSAGVTIEQPEEGYEEDFMLAHRLLTAAGLEHYEVSNYARPGRVSRHNSSYWAGVPYVGLGPSAHEYDGAVRRWNARNFSAWSELVWAGTDPVEGHETLSPENRVAEQVYLGLRTRGGLAIGPTDRGLTDRWVSEGWLLVDDGGVARCTPSGWLRLDALAAALTHHRSR